MSEIEEVLKEYRSFIKAHPKDWTRGVSMLLEHIENLESQLAVADQLAKLMDGYDHSMHSYDDDCAAWGDNLNDGDGYAPYPEKCTCGLTEIINATEKYQTLRKASSGKGGGE